MTGVGFATQANTNIKALRAASEYRDKMGKHLVFQHSLMIVAGGALVLALSAFGSLRRRAATASGGHSVAGSGVTAGSRAVCRWC
jgi:hypothetical protein